MTAGLAAGTFNHSAPVTRRCPRSHFAQVLSTQPLHTTHGHGENTRHSLPCDRDRTDCGIAFGSSRSRDSIQITRLNRPVKWGAADGLITQPFRAQLRGWQTKEPPLPHGDSELTLNSEIESLRFPQVRSLVTRQNAEVFRREHEWCAEGWVDKTLRRNGPSTPAQRPSSPAE